jgi:hypothetical protein
MTAADWFATDDASVYEVRTSAPGPAGSLPLTDHMLRFRPSGDLFGWSQDAAMGWDPKHLGRPEFLILSTQGGVRAPDGSPIALGYHTGHWEIGLLVEAAANEIRRRGGIPFALRKRPSRNDLAAADGLPDDTRLWAALQQVGGGTWGGCVYDVDAVVERLAQSRQGS